MSLETELTAIRQGAAVFPLTDRGFLRITGLDATRWLNGMVTNSIQSLAPGEGNYNFLLNAQGRIQGECTIYREPGDAEPVFLLETDLSQLETIHQTLDRFIIMDDVELSSAMTDTSGLLLIGADALGSLDVACLWPTPPISIYQGTAAGDPLVLAISKNMYEIWGDAKSIERISFNVGRHFSAEAIEALRILEGRPKFGVDIRDRDLPQETNQIHALHFNKGCYLGQEIVERIRSRGQVHRQFTPLQLTGSLPTLPAPLEAAGKPAGELTSAIQIGDQIVALGYVRRDALQEPLTYSGGTATIRQLS